MRDFDAMREEKDLSFKLGGQVFKMKMVPFTVYGEWEAREAKLDFTKTEDFLAAGQARIRSVLDDSNGQVERWDALIASPQCPTLGELSELMSWILEVQTDRPTQQPSLSVAGAGATATSSKGKSS